MSEVGKLITIGMVLVFILGLGAIACEWRSDAACAEAIKVNARAWCF